MNDTRAIRARDEQQKVGFPKQTTLSGSAGNDATTVHDDVGIGKKQPCRYVGELLIKDSCRVGGGGAGQHLQSARELLQVGSQVLLAQTYLSAGEDQARHAATSREAESSRKVTSRWVAFGHEHVPLGRPHRTKSTRKGRDPRGALRGTEGDYGHDSGVTTTRAACPAADALAMTGARVLGTSSDTTTVSEPEDAGDTATSVTLTSGARIVPGPLTPPGSDWPED